MAYFNQEMKRERAPAIRKIIKQYGLKATLGVNHHSTFVLNIWSGPIDFIGDLNRDCDKIDPITGMTGNYVRDDYIQVNNHYIDSHHSGIAKRCLLELYSAMMTGNYNNSDIQTDYFDVGWYVDINIGRYNRPYVLNS